MAIGVLEWWSTDSVRESRPLTASWLRVACSACGTRSRVAGVGGGGADDPQPQPVSSVLYERKKCGPHHLLHLAEIQSGWKTRTFSVFTQAA